MKAFRQLQTTENMVNWKYIVGLEGGRGKWFTYQQLADHWTYCCTSDFNVIILITGWGIRSSAHNPR